MASKDDIFGKDAKKEAMSIKEASDSETSNSGSGKRANKLSGRKQTLSGEGGAGNVRSAGGKVANVKGTIDGKAVKQPSIFQKIGTGLLNVGKKALGNVKDALIQKGLDLVSDFAINKLIKCGSQGKYIDPTLLVAAYKLKNWVIQKERLGFKDKSIDFEKGLGHDAIDVNAGRKGRFPTRFGWPLVQKGLNILGSTYDNFVQYLDAIDNTNNNNRYGNLSMKTYTDYAKDDYKGINVYGTLVNTFPDDLGALNDSPASNDNGNYGAASHTWGTNYNSNSIMAKTKRLFRWNKINTIISRFSTFNTGSEHRPMDSWDVGTSEYGLSHGRNLLKREAELNGGNSYLINGYNNPYCRVWTHHYQMDNIAKLIRPFTDEDGIPEKKSDFHRWNNFKPDGAINIGDKYIDNNGKEKLWGWKSDTDGWQHSVLNDNGFVQIAPYRDRYSDGKANIHTKDCMFSIENLAWKGYDPFSFEKALSWEQRGPMGGRIMWFPPYGIQFNESTNSEWQSNTFIGRGEPVYTYSNSQRQGNLTFLMVVDHPSILDYCTWYDNETGKRNTTVKGKPADVSNIPDTMTIGDDGNTKGPSNVNPNDLSSLANSLNTGIHSTYKIDNTELKKSMQQVSANTAKTSNEYDDSNDLRDTDILRFFAGCDDGALINAAKPTPLTDEYIKMPPPEVQYMKPPKETIPPDKTMDISFFVFFPNNYSGYYDLPTAATNHGPESVKGKYTPVVHSIAYLLNGNTAQKNMIDGKNVGGDSTDPYYGDKKIDFEDPYASETESDPDPGRGYEMVPGDNRGVTSVAITQLEPENMRIHYPIVGSETLFWNFRNSMSGRSISATQSKRNTYHWLQVDKHVDGGYPSGGGDGFWENNKKLFYKGKYTPALSHLLWYYRIDGIYHVPVPSSEKYSNTFDQRLTIDQNYMDVKSYGFNSSLDSIKKYFSSEIEEDTGDRKTYCLLEMAYAVRANSEDLKNKVKGFSKYANNADDIFGKRFGKNGHNYTVDEKRINELVDVLANYDLQSIDGIGYSNSHGINTASVNNARNKALSEQRLNTVADWLSDCGIWRSKDNVKPNITYRSGVKVVGEDPTSVDNASAKFYRSVKVTLHFKKSATKDAKDIQILLADGTEANLSYKQYEGGFQKATGNFQYGVRHPHSFKEIYIKTENKKQTIWVIVPDGPHKGEMVLADKLDDVYTGDTFLERNGGKPEDLQQRNAVRYDQEYYFFRTLEEKAPITYSKLMDKLRYFDPAFHSMTPEGFNARLTFLQQCMRQGNTIGASDVNAKSANNLAFGRPPVCILRLGDFFRTQIIITNLNISYEAGNGIQWDLNEEGIGVQPLLATVNLSFNIIGGADLTGPIRRLQNAMSFNYYANARLYDNRADRVEYETNSMNETSSGAPQTGFGNITSYTAYNAAMSDLDKETNKDNTPETDKSVEDNDKK